jgi:hypothetical protein
MHNLEQLASLTYSYAYLNCCCRNVPSRAVLPVIRPALGRQQSISDRAKVAMQEYLNHFMGNLDIVNSREVTKSMFWYKTSKFKYRQNILHV